MKSRLFALVALCALPLAGCGSGGGGGAGADADPAKLVPASAPLYAEATIRPEGGKRDDAEAAAKKLLRTDDPAKKAIQLFDKAVKSDKISWEKDFQPWLGQRIGVFATEFSNGGTFAVIAASKNEDKAKDTIHKAVANNDSTVGASKISKRKYKGVEYEYDVTDKDAGGIVDGYAVIGSEPGFRLVVDTSKGGRNITSNAEFRSGRAAAGADDSLANVWADPQKLLDAVGEMPQAGSALPVLRQVFAQVGNTAAAAFGADGDALRMDFATLGAPDTGAGKSGADVAGALPDDAWLAIGIADVGKGIRKGFSQFEQLGNFGGVDVGGMMNQFESQAGLNVKRDLLSWMGDAAVYARGSSLADLGGALTITSTNPARSRAAAKKIASVLHQYGASPRPADIPGYDNAYQIRFPGLPVAFFVAGSGERLSIGVNPDALEAVADPTSKLADAKSFDAAAKTLGSGIRPSVLIDFPRVVQLLEGLGVGNDSSYRQAKPYLEAIGVISAGAARDGETSKARVAVGLK